MEDTEMKEKSEASTSKPETSVKTTVSSTVSKKSKPFKAKVASYHKCIACNKEFNSLQSVLQHAITHVTVQIKEEPDILDDNAREKSSAKEVNSNSKRKSRTPTKIIKSPNKTLNKSNDKTETQITQASKVLTVQKNTPNKVVEESAVEKLRKIRRINVTHQKTQTTESTENSPVELNNSEVKQESDSDQESVLWNDAGAENNWTDSESDTREPEQNSSETSLIVKNKEEGTKIKKKRRTDSSSSLKNKKEGKIKKKRRTDSSSSLKNKEEGTKTKKKRRTDSSSNVKNKEEGKIKKKRRTDSSSSVKNGEEDKIKKKQRTVGTHQCDICQKWLSNEKSLRTHKISYHNLEYKCRYCREVVTKSHKCPVEDKPERKPEKLSIKCEECQQGFKWHATYLRHKESFHGPTTECIKCGKVATKIHNCLNGFECPLCQKEFKCIENVSVHMLNKHSEENEKMAKLKCHLCNMRFLFNSKLETHLKTHQVQSVKCEICNKLYTVRGLQKHNKKFHSVKEGVGPSKDDTGTTFLCTLCGGLFNTAYLLKLHMQRAHKAENLDQNKDENFNFICEYCSKGFKIQGKLERHVNVVHKGEKRYGPCEKCGEKFVNCNDFKEHVQNGCQTPLTPKVKKKRAPPMQQACPICFKIFSSNKSMNRHKLAVHLGIKAHQCTVCEKSFAQRENLMSHMKIHTGERTYECSYCDQKFAQLSNMKTHMKRHEGEPKTYQGTPVKKRRPRLSKHQVPHPHQRPQTSSAEVLVAPEPNVVLLELQPPSATFNEAFLASESLRNIYSGYVMSGSVFGTSTGTQTHKNPYS